MIVGIPAIIAALGFGAGGIGAGAFGAWLMPWWGGGVPAGGIAGTYAGKALLAAGCLELVEVEVCS